MTVFVNRLLIYAKNISGRIMAVALDEKNLVAEKWVLARFFFTVSPFISLEPFEMTTF